VQVKGIVQVLKVGVYEGRVYSHSIAYIRWRLTCPQLREAFKRAHVEAKQPFLWAGAAPKQILAT